MFTEAVDGIVYTSEHLYDEGDQLRQMVLPSSRIIDYQRDGVRRIQAIDTSLSGQAQAIVGQVAYRGDSQMTQCTYGRETKKERETKKDIHQLDWIIVGAGAEQMDVL